MHQENIQKNLEMLEQSHGTDNTSRAFSPTRLSSDRLAETKKAIPKLINELKVHHDFSSLFASLTEELQTKIHNGTLHEAGILNQDTVAINNDPELTAKRALAKFLLEPRKQRYVASWRPDPESSWSKIILPDYDNVLKNALQAYIGLEAYRTQLDKIRKMQREADKLIEYYHSIDTGYIAENLEHWEKQRKDLKNTIDFFEEKKVGSVTAYNSWKYAEAFHKENIAQEWMSRSQDLPDHEKVLFDKGLVITHEHIMNEIKFDDREYIFYPQEIRIEAWRERKISDENASDLLTGMPSMWYKGVARSHDLSELRNFIEFRITEEFKKHYIQSITTHLDTEPDLEMLSMLKRQDISLEKWTTILQGTKKFLETGKELSGFALKVKVHCPHLEKKLENLRVLKCVESEPEKDSDGNSIKDNLNHIKYRDKEGAVAVFYATTEPESLWEKIEGKSYIFDQQHNRKPKRNKISYSYKMKFGALNDIFNYNKNLTSIMEKDEEGRIAKWQLVNDETLGFDDVRILLDYRLLSKNTSEITSKITMVTDIEEKVIHISKSESGLSLLLTNNKSVSLLHDIRKGQASDNKFKVYI